MSSISVVTVSMDRNEFLPKNFISTSKIKNLKEHIHVDFSSGSDLTELKKLNNKLKIVKVKNETEWWLGRAFNLGFNIAEGDYILRLNADTEVIFEEFNKINLKNKSYINFKFGDGDYGNFLCSKNYIEAINGYNEFIFGWGYDDHDLHRRLTKLDNLDVKVFQGKKYLKIEKHDDSLRISSSKTFTKNFIDAYLLASHKKNKFISLNTNWDKSKELNYKNESNEIIICHYYKLEYYHYLLGLRAKSIFISTFLNELLRRKIFNTIRFIFYFFPKNIFEFIFKVNISPK